MEKKGELTDNKTMERHGHAVCLPFPAQGHINPMLKLAILLHQTGFRITFVNTEYNHNRFLKSRGPSAVSGFPDFEFATIPDFLPTTENGGESTQDIPLLCRSTSQNCLGPLIELLGKLNEDDNKVSCVITDAIMSFGLDAAEKIGVPGVLLRTAGACSFMCDKQFECLVDMGILPLQDENCFTNGYLDTSIHPVPGMVPLRLKDLPIFTKSIDPNGIMLNFLISESSRSSNASAIIINTFYELEKDVVNALSLNCPPIYIVGPLQFLFNSLIPQTNILKSMSSSLWKEEPDCLRWLNSKPRSSVIYVNFGSITVLTAQQLNEFAYGLAKSKRNFLWVVRPDLVQGESGALLPEYWEEVGERGFVAKWSPQEEVLNHTSVGGFLTHCGWNSILESLFCGVPMLCWPFFADQFINCRYVCDVWGVGMKIEGDVTSDKVRFLIKELLEGEQANAMKMKAMEWKEKTAEAIAPGGNSYRNLERLVAQVSSV